jgi:hypothetical protein
VRKVSYIIIVATQVQGSIVPGSGLINIKDSGFLTVNPEPANPNSFKLSLPAPQPMWKIYK